MHLLPLTRIRQQFDRTRLEDVPGAVRAALTRAAVTLPEGEIAIAVGSRGIANLLPIVREVVAWVKAAGRQPFLVPAMGSHGGATATGQREVLEGYGLTEDAVGAPIRSSMEVVELPSGEAGIPVYCDRAAAGAAGTIVINRIKPHTSFHGRYESGLMKMLAIGLGKHKQALAIHALGVEGLSDVMPRVARQVLHHGNIVLGLAIVENAFDETLCLQAIPAQAIPDEEPALLDLARAHMPSLPIDDLDLLIVDEVGKNISGLGMDPNIIGRLKIAGQPEPERPRIRCILIRDLHPDSHGNACGMGLADLTTQKLVAKIDFAATYANVATTGFLERAKLPLAADTDADAIAIGLRACGITDPLQARILRIRNTLHLDELQASPAVVAEVAGKVGIEVLGPVGEAFTEAGELRAFGEATSFVNGIDSLL
jgi:hypothetical protein